MNSTTLTYPLRQHRTRLGAIAAAALLAGCSLVPTYERPVAPIGADWPVTAGAVSVDGVAAADLPWEQFVQDAQLRDVIALALQNNRDLRVAVQNIEQARAQYQIRRADQVPSLGATAGGTRSSPNPYAALGGSNVSCTYNIGVGVSAWELDFFGRVAALKDVALADYLATEEARKTAQISLIASVMTTWLQLKTDTELLALTERTLATRDQSLRLTKLRFDNGASSALDMRQAESLSASAQATRAQQKRLRAQDINLLTLLVGAPVPDQLIPPVPAVDLAEAPNDLTKPTAAVAPAAPLPGFTQLPAGLPSDLLLRRPDIRAAEQQLVGANANIGAARANFFPRINLTAAIGTGSRALSALFEGGNGTWNVDPAIALPIFDGGANRANLRVAQVDRDLAVNGYDRAVQAAFREVADALAERLTWQQRLAAATALVDANQKALDLSNARFKAGTDNYLSVLDAQRSLYLAQQQLISLRLAEQVNRVALYKALGGDSPETR